MLNQLSYLKDYRTFWFVTITPYDRDIEKYVPMVDQVIQSFKELSNKVGKDKVRWRYDPILLNDKYTIDYHIKVFRYANESVDKVRKFYNQHDINSSLLIGKLNNDDQIKYVLQKSYINQQLTLDIF